MHVMQVNPVPWPVSSLPPLLQEFCPMHDPQDGSLS